MDRNTAQDSISVCDGAQAEFKGGVLHIQTPGNFHFPRIFISGRWDLTQYNEMEMTVENLDKQNPLKFRITVAEPGAPTWDEKWNGAFIGEVSVPAGEKQKVSLQFPPKYPHRDVMKELLGKRNIPFYSFVGTICDIDWSNVGQIVIYTHLPAEGSEWSISDIRVKPGTPAPLPEWATLPYDKFFPFVDRFGQFKHKEWPGKVQSEEELTQNLAAELASMEADPGPKDRSRYGGWTAGPKLKATGFFRVEKVDGRWWMVDPEGNLYWSHGVVRVTPSCGVTPLDGRKFYFEYLPPADSPLAEFYTTNDQLLRPYYEARNIKETYDFSAANIYRKYGEGWRDKYADMIHKRLSCWGITTIANSSDKSICLMDKTPYADRIEIKSQNIEGSVSGWWKFKDPFNPEFKADARRQLLERKKEMDDPWCIGYFVDNEIMWGTETSLAEWCLMSPASQPAKKEMISRLKKKYGGIETLNSTWGGNYASWEALSASTEAPPAGSKEDCVEFSEAVVDAYFKNTREAFKSVAPNKLYMGCRFAVMGNCAYNPRVLKIAAKYCDVLSFNIYRRELDTFILPEGIDLPVMIGEFHFGALDRGLYHTGLIATASQEERATAYRVYLGSALRHPNIVGTHWHQFSDQAVTGRFDGENFQVGFTDICDTPYPETISAVKEIGYNMYNMRSGSRLRPSPMKIQPHSK